MRARFFGADASTAHTTERCSARYRRRVPLAGARHPRRATAIDALFAEHARRDRARDPHRRAAVARLGGVGPADRLRASTPTARSTCSRRRAATLPAATFIFCSTNKVYGDLPNAAAAGRARRRAWSCPRTTATTAGIDTTMSIDASTHSLFGVSKAAADLLVQEYGRYFDMPTVCFRGGCLTGPEPRRRAAARLPLLPDALHDDRRALHRVRLRRQAGARQHPLGRPRGRVRGLPPRAARRRRLQHRRRPREQLLDARGDRALRADRRARARLDARRATTGSAITAGGSAT